MIKKIMLAYNGKPGAEKALKKTARMAELLKAEVYVITIEPIPRYSETMDEIEEQKERQDKNYEGINEKAVNFLKDKGIKVHPFTAYGRVSKEIVIHAKSLNVDLIIMGRKRHTDIAKRIYHMFGCITSRVLEHSHCSVFVVK